ncbi:uncharacterized protein LOC123532031 [Mercenaria mercenaria]|uniref:uncharacterized protein LOC123532031 n=1 Tax=Mercenaria mercenaria TaxID=6596 RepID=UPI00234F3C42|nr:uncharacterized protein LOC123532031 [Mercenaria mercenaria]
MAEADVCDGSQEGRDDPLLAIFGSGRISSRTASQPSQDVKDMFGMEASSNQIIAAKGQNQFTTDMISQPSCEAESQDGSRDLFSTQTSQGSLLDEQIDITLQLTESVWVQCDNPDCQKWRRIPAPEAEDLSTDPWYCYMSSDPMRHTCSAPEEDHAMYDRMAKKAGIKFVMSMLSVGSLVWAKMAGYCRWPALVTRDPDVGCHMLIDIDGDPHSYHVEFLGKQHSHSWVAAKFVEVYGHKAVPELEESQSQTEIVKGKKLQRGPGRRRWKKVALTNQASGKKRTSYKRMHIAAVVQEADFLLGLETEERIKYSVFKFDPDKKRKIGKQEKKDSQTSCEKCSQCKKTGRKRKFAQAGKEQDPHLSNETIATDLKEMTDAQFKRGELYVGGGKIVKTGEESQIRGGKTMKKGEESQARGGKIIKKGKENREVYHYCSDMASASHYEMSLDEGISVKTVKTEVSVFDSPDQFSQSRLKFMNPMEDKSKEEKFSIDLDMYRKNEKAFEHDVRRFMSRNGQSIRNTPVWHTVPVRLFQLYLAVHERGGFQQVNKKKQWTSVYKELTEQQHVSSGAVAKKYYLNNLYPYELYITGKSYQDVLSGRKRQVSKSRQKRKSETSILVEKTLQTIPTEKNVTTDLSPVLFKEDGTTFSQDIEAILDQLEEDYSPQDQNKERSCKKPGLKFHDDNTDSQSQEVHKVPSEFHPSTTGDDVQQVPNDCFSGDGLSDIEEKILHEMKALEDDLNEISDLD